ncbi:MAG: hypothetical protein EA374_00310 [Acholeplasmatales bacterium]|nr:MAG: hypothetical protein EA374_00310 [Acholeplasmatales bacterium]
MKKTFFLLAFLFIAGIGIILSRNDSATQSISVYERYEIDNLSTEEMVESLDAKTLDSNIIGAAILARELIISHADGEDRYAIDEDRFYLSFAPYITTTHPCHNHNLVTCRGELAGEIVKVFIQAVDGKVLFDGEVELYDNGFKGIWLPSNTEATMTVEYDGLRVSTQIATYDDSGTCLTEELQLS